MDLITVALFFIVVFVVRVWQWERSSFVQKIDKLPGPTKIPLFGNVFDLPPGGYALLKKYNVEWVQKYGHLYRVWRGHAASVNTSSAAGAEVYLGNRININKSISSLFLKPWLGNGLITSGGDKWKKDRRLLTPAFHFQILDGFFDVFNRNAKIFIEQIGKKLSESSELDIYPLTSLCTLDIICEASMGTQMNFQINSNSEYIKAIESVEALIQGRLNSFQILLPDWFYFNFTGHGHILKKDLKKVHDFALKTIQERKALRNLDESENQHSKPIEKRRAFLDLLLQSVRDGADLSERDILEQVDTFMFAGHDTTSVAITWFLYCMALNQDIQERVYQEIIDHFGQSDRYCVLEDLGHLKYLDCCVKESLRLHPPVPLIRRELDQEVEINGFKIPAGTNLGLQIYALHHNEELFPNPLEYNPERFTVDNSVGRHPYAFVPFSGGPRNCIGNKFAIYEDKVIVVNLLRKFHFDIDPKHVPVKETYNVILKPDPGMPLIVTPRK